MNMTLKQALSPKAIVIAAGGACLLYAALLALSLLRGDHVLDTLESNMAVQRIAFEKAITPDPEPVHHEAAHIAAPVHGDVHHGDAHAPDPVHGGDHVTDEDLAIDKNGLNAPLPPAPYDGLTEESPFGDLPIIGKNKLKPFDAYKKHYVLDVKKHSIGIGITGIGLSSALSDEAFKVLTPNVSLILSPYIDDIDHFQKTARAKGYETWLTLPLETKKFPNVDPGSLGILADGGLRFNQDNLRRVLSSTQGYAGIAAYSDAAFINAKPMLVGILSDTMIRGLGFLEMNAGRDAQSLKLAVSNRAPYVSVSTRIREQSLEKTFTKLKKIAKNDKSAVGVIELNPAMLEAFRAEVIQAQQEGFEIVPLSTLTNTF